VSIHGCKRENIDLERYYVALGKKKRYSSWEREIWIHRPDERILLQKKDKD
jgi:hypothetical protein